MSSKRIASGHARRIETSRRTVLRTALATLGTASLTGCDRLSNSPAWVHTLQGAERLNQAAQAVVAPRRAMAQEFSPADVAAHFKGNGTLMPGDADYQALRQGGFKDWALHVTGLVERPASYTLEQLRAMPSRTQITRHDCVEGWSSIGKWTGVPLWRLLDEVRPTAAARFAVFHCADSMDRATLGAADSHYYESIDLEEAAHPQTLLAYALNDQPLPVANGAPLRLRVERQLGYKHAKYLTRVDFVESFASLRGGRGGYWEDNGYEWYAGI